MSFFIAILFFYFSTKSLCAGKASCSRNGAAKLVNFLHLAKFLPDKKEKISKRIGWQENWLAFRITP